MTRAEAADPFVIGKNGMIEHEPCPVYDGTLGDCGTIFDMLVGSEASRIDIPERTPNARTS